MGATKPLQMFALTESHNMVVATEPTWQGRTNVTTSSGPPGSLDAALYNKYKDALDLHIDEARYWLARNPGVTLETIQPAHVQRHILNCGFGYANFILRRLRA